MKINLLCYSDQVLSSLTWPDHYFCLAYGGEQKDLVNSQVFLNLTPLKALAICVFKAFVTQRVC